ncbi:cytochrome C [Chryseobacterium sp. Leaf180]|uniref:c-type cytochrome n=1 Tax=Chryseobacterium sp. Leaf180 TaxID=1736289 RepID=UPI0006F5D87F|nr:c-type cytochrome [Chryseobacterium sp. Leaf180]KQR94941.1 cytochrome C [Chryseobacterium sp. Leaf180]
MRKIIAALAFSFFVFSCEKKDSGSSTIYNDQKTAENAKKLSGEELIAGSDCMSCHQLDERMIGPSYHEIAARYTGKDAEMLASKIIEGGKGNWGDVPMQAHPQISKEEAKFMVQYILSQKK